VFNPFTLLPSRPARPVPTLSHRESPRLRVSVMMLARALRRLCRTGDFSFPGV